MEKSLKRRRSPGDREEIAGICRQTTSSTLLETAAESVVAEGGEEKEEKQLEDQRHLPKEGEGACESESEEEEGDGDEGENEDADEDEDDDEEEEDEDEYESEDEDCKLDLGYRWTKRPNLKVEDSIELLPNIINESRDLGPSLYTDRDFGPWVKPTTLLEVFNVKISGGAGKCLHGKIMFNDFKGVVYLYNKPSDQCELIGDGDEAVLKLTGPYRALQIARCINFYFGLYVTDTKDSKEEKEVSRGGISWHSLTIIPGLFSDVAPGICGSAKVSYAVIRDGVEAAVRVRITGGCVKNLSAKVVARNKKLKNQEVVLFDDVLDDALVDVEGFILLSLSVIAVPVQNNSLEIVVILGSESYTAHFGSTLLFSF